MTYNGEELNEFTSDKPVTFNPPKKMLVWDGESCAPVQNDVYAYMPEYGFLVICLDDFWHHCAEIPKAVPCWYCTPGLSNTTEQKNFNYCPICGRKRNKENQ